MRKERLKTDTNNGYFYLKPFQICAKVFITFLRTIDSSYFLLRCYVARVE